VRYVLEISASSADKLNVEDYVVKNPEWKNVVMPEIMDGKNTADFIDPTLSKNLRHLNVRRNASRQQGTAGARMRHWQVLHVLLTTKTLTIHM